MKESMKCVILCVFNQLHVWLKMYVSESRYSNETSIDWQTNIPYSQYNIKSNLYTNQQTPTAKHFLYMKNLKIMIFIICCKVCSICSFSPRTPNLEIFSIYSNKFFHNFHLFESSFTCPGLRASGLAWRLHMSEMTFLSLLQQNILDVYQ